MRRSAAGSVVFLLLVLALSAAGASCGRDAPKPAVAISVGPADAVAPLSIASAAATTAATPSGPNRWAVVTTSTTAIDMQAPKEHFRAETKAARGSIYVNLADLKSTRGNVQVDLISLRTFTFGDAQKDADQTEHAKTWLEAEIQGVVDNLMRWTVFTIDSIATVSPANDASEIPADAAGARVAMVTAHGSYRLHGHIVGKDVDLRVEILPSTILVTTAKPLSITIAEHDIKPRDTMGVIARSAFNLLGTKVADVADVTVEMGFERGR